MTQQDKIRLIDSLCERCKVAYEQLAQTVGQPQWLIDSTLQGKVTNEVTIAAIISRLLQIYRKKLNCDLNDAEKGTLVNRERLKRWESGQKIDFDMVEDYLDRLASYVKNKNVLPTFRTKHITQTIPETKTSNVVEKTTNSNVSLKTGFNDATKCVEKQRVKYSKKRRLEEIRKKALGIMAGTILLPETPKLYPEPSFLKAANEKYEREKNNEINKSNVIISKSDVHYRYGKLIWNMMLYIVRNINYRRLTTDLANKGFDTGAILSMKDGSYEDIDGYKIVAAYCLYLIGSARAASEKSWPKGAGISYTVYCYITENPTGANTTIERCEALFPLLKNYRSDYRPKQVKQEQTQDDTGYSITSHGHSVRHRSYNSNRGGFDYGITDT